MRVLKYSALAVTLALFLPAVVLAQAAMKPATHMVTPEKLTWAPIQPPGFDPGATIAVIHGNPDAESGTYVLRLAFPDGYKFPAHWHPNAENLTVLEGSFMLGMGNKADPTNLVSYPPGTFMYIPAKDPHFGQAKGRTIVQLNGQAPFKIELAKP